MPQSHQAQSYASMYPQYPGMLPTAPPVAAPPSLPAGWKEYKTEDGTLYWHNASTGVSQVSLNTSNLYSISIK